METIERRTLLGAALAAVATTSACGSRTTAPKQTEKKATGVVANPRSRLPKGVYDAVKFPLIDAIHGRRSRRFAKGAEIPAGPLAYKSKQPAKPLTELEQMMLVSTVSGNTGWSNLIPHNQFYQPHLPNYGAAAGGRTFPSAAGFHTSELFYTDDSGVYFIENRDAAAAAAVSRGDVTDLEAYLAEHKARRVKLADGRLNLPASPQHMEPHNFWCANAPGSTLLIPVADLAQHHLLGLCYLVQSGACIYDDIANKPIAGLEKFKSLVDLDNPYPMSFVEQMSLTEVAVETSTACYAGALMLQALGLGGWMYHGINQLSVLGASGDPEVPGLGFRFDTDKRWPLPNVTGLPQHFEGHCPPHFSNMRAAVQSVVDRKFGAGGPFNPSTAGPYKDNRRVRAAGQKHDDAFIDCVTVMADYIHTTYGKFPATVPSIFAMMYLQAHQLDTEFYDQHFRAGSYLATHRHHDANWKEA